MPRKLFSSLKLDGDCVFSITIIQNRFQISNIFIFNLHIKQRNERKTIRLYDISKHMWKLYLIRLTLIVLDTEFLFELHLRKLLVPIFLQTYKEIMISKRCWNSFSCIVYAFLFLYVLFFMLSNLQIFQYCLMSLCTSLYLFSWFKLLFMLNDFFHWCCAVFNSRRSSFYGLCDLGFCYSVLCVI